MTTNGYGNRARRHFSDDEKRLILAVESGSDAALRLAILAFKDCSRQDAGELNRALLFAVQCDALDACRCLLSYGADVEACEPTICRTPLIIACERNGEPVVSLLLKAGADVHAADDFGNTALAVGAVAGSATLIEMLIAHGADPERRNDLGWTPLIAASASGNLSAVDVLSRHGASVDAKAVLGWTPLIVAAQSNHSEVVMRLLELGARLDVVDSFGRTALSASLHAEAGEDVLQRLSTGEGQATVPARI